MSSVEHYRLNESTLDEDRRLFWPSALKVGVRDCLERDKSPPRRCEI